MRFITTALLFACSVLSSQTDECYQSADGPICVKTFKNVNAMIKSSFWREVVKAKSIYRANSTVMVIADSKTSYFFGESELTGEDSKSGWLNKRSVNLIEVEYGGSETAEVVDIPISSCISAMLTDASVGYSQDNKFGTGLSVSASPSGSIGLTISGIGLGVSGGGLGFSFGNGGGASCNVAAGRRVQVFGSYEYKYYPNAKKRGVCIDGKKVETDKWEKFSTNDDPKYTRFGLVFLNIEKIPEYYCVDSEEKMDCSRGGTFDIGDSSLEKLARIV